jgi:hypothetical protein
MSDIDYPELSKEELCMLLVARDKELYEWRKLEDPTNLHANLLRGMPAKLDQSAFLHLAGATDYPHLKEHVNSAKALLTASCRILSTLKDPKAEDVLVAIVTYLNRP